MIKQRSRALLLQAAPCFMLAGGVGTLAAIANDVAMHHQPSQEFEKQHQTIVGELQQKLHQSSLNVCVSPQDPSLVAWLNDLDIVVATRKVRAADASQTQEYLLTSSAVDGETTSQFGESVRLDINNPQLVNMFKDCQVEPRFEGFTVEV